jgi:hypothetical protein
MRWCAQVAEMDAVQLILRPRPATPGAVFASRVAHVLTTIPDQLTITADDSVRDWILASDVVVSSYSTSLIEASIAGKPAYIVEPSDWPADLHQPWHDLTPRIRSAEAFVNVVQMGSQAERAGRLAAWARETFMARGDAILLIADEISRTVTWDRPIPDRAPWRAIALPGRRHVPSWTAHLYRRHLKPLRPTSVPVPDEYIPDVAAVTSIPERVERWRAVLAGYLRALAAKG